MSMRNPGWQGGHAGSVPRGPRPVRFARPRPPIGPFSLYWSIGLPSGKRVYLNKRDCVVALITLAVLLAGFALTLGLLFWRGRSDGS